MMNRMPVDMTSLRDFVAREASLIEEAMRGDLAEVLKDNDPLLVEVIEYALFGEGRGYDRCWLFLRQEYAA